MLHKAGYISSLRESQGRNPVEGDADRIPVSIQVTVTYFTSITYDLHVTHVTLCLLHYVLHVK